jgi:mono/diheme cytochrome c family protein
MNRRIVKHFALGAITAYSFAVIVLVCTAKLGILPVQADVAPGRLEASLFGWALHASVARRAPAAGDPLPASEENLIAGAKLYRQMCSRCHGAPEESNNSYGQSFYPPAPNLPVTRTSYTDSEIFWVVKHGIRNTAMPAWGNLLSDDEIWHIVTLVKKFDSLPDSVTVELFGHHH